MLLGHKKIVYLMLVSRIMEFVLSLMSGYLVANQVRKSDRPDVNQSYHGNGKSRMEPE